MVNHLTYPPQTLIPSDEKCVVCFHDYKNGDNIVQLACQHIFHENCFSDNVVRCLKPDCLKRIEGRALNLSREELYKELEEFIKVFKEVVPELDFYIDAEMESNEEKDKLLVAAKVNIAFSILESGRETKIVEPVSSNLLISKIKELAQDILDIKSRKADRFPEMLKRHATYLMDFIEDYYLKNDPDFREEFCFEDCKRIPRFLLHLEKKKKISPELKEYLNLLFRQLIQAPRFMKIIETREKACVKAFDRYVDSHSILDIFRYITSLSLPQQKVVGQYGSSHERLNILMAAQATIVTLCVMAIAISTYRIYKDFYG